MQDHQFHFDVDGTPQEVWDVFWSNMRSGVKTEAVTIEIYHPGDEQGNGLVRHCDFAVPKYLLSKGRAQSWEWITEAQAPVSWKYDAIGKPLWSRASGMDAPGGNRRGDPGPFPRDLRGVQPGHAQPAREAGARLHLQGQRQAAQGVCGAQPAATPPERRRPA